jgi:hypothetical protein
MQEQPTTEQRIRSLMEATGTTDPYEISATLFDEDVAKFGPQHSDLHGDYFAAAEIIVKLPTGATSAAFPVREGTDL